MKKFNLKDSLNSTRGYSTKIKQHGEQFMIDILKKRQSKIPMTTKKADIKDVTFLTQTVQPSASNKRLTFTDTETN